MLLNLIKELAQIIVDFFIWIFYLPKKNNTYATPTRIVAHRGWHGNQIVENTYRSFSLALEHKIYGIEFDIRWTKDHVPVVHHDASLLRLWKREELIEELTFEELNQIAPEIPMLETVLKDFAQKIHLFIEIKNDGFKDIEIKKEKLKTLISQYLNEKDYDFLILDLEILKAYNNFDSKKFLIVSELNPHPLWSQVQLEKIEIGGFTGHYLLINDSLLKELKSKGLKVGLGFIRTQSSLARERSRSVDLHFTNHPWNLLNSNR